MRPLAGLFAGLVFGLGLALSGMMNPARILGFLDVAGAWDPSLAFVLVGAVAVSTIGVLLARRCRTPVFAQHFGWPAVSGIDAKLLTGAALFGIGWGLAGFCPGPAIASLTLGLGKSFLFVAAMLAGMALYRITVQSRRRQ
ncbi:MAG TPA: DUF6691 family protein [Acidisoma sp.]|uniref:DUF6691 family protein n=1 Tax=Acidisoma sp. TaxID=1872115 RepID=UPI002BC93176|nr:DUF6691 family protein [Acidisoma sp.]HTI02228.1 DUF6691 family protein [Acidisoma sp.]